ncbi:AAA family ATPase [Vibrio coralliilyticus OCN008]|uniref:AAA family ATPase n=1 Tax=Vibrio coralliilyticus TaxID=190893 RepID=UPI0003F4B5C1|nr:AAA family ATPase [Vibrio coralliilyticus]QIJ86938.1 AAA family ATPase [Vibrio coralliilyticus OCN008]
MKRLNRWLESLALDHSPDFAECRSYLASHFPLLNEFENTEQDKEWHAEGNVAIHTDMVLQALYVLLSSRATHIQGAERQVLILSALLHDIAKPLTTRRKDIAGVERVVASRHEEIGASYLATRLMELPLAYKSVMKIMGLVGFHQVPKLLVVKNQGYSDYFRLSLNANLELLYWLEQADMKGRTCSDLDKQIDLLEQFRLFAEDYQLWGIEDPMDFHLRKIQLKSCQSEQAFLDGYAIQQLSQGDISTVEQAIAKNYEPCQNYSHLYLMCGMSGSGKSTWIEKNLEGYDVISLDEIRKELNGKRYCQKNRGQVLQLAKTRLKKALANKRNVVWDATNIRKDFRNTICELGENYGALITMVVFQLKESSLRVNNRNRQYAVGDEVISSQLTKLEWPWPTESHRFLVIGENGSELYRKGTFS